MAKKVLKANIFSMSSIQELQKQLREYQDSLNKKCEIFTEELAKRGVEIAKASAISLHHHSKLTAIDKKYHP
jgi:Na+-transporting methylmalonyl-CoA/oxaloacetate decarboxylase gamma subunit